MTGRVVIVTGANTGLGFKAAELLCEAGNDVILACRNEEKAKVALEKIFKKFPNALATFMQLDLADLSSVRKFVDDFHATEKKLNVLVNNGGAWGKDQRQFTKDNFELMMGTNHLGPFLLTQLLLDDLKKTAEEEGADVRIVNVTSSIHDPEQSKKGKARVNMDMEDFFLAKEGSFFAMQGYKNSKAAMVMCTYEMAKQFKDSNVTVNCVCPGFVPKTELRRNAGKVARASSFVMGSLLRPVLKSVRTVDQGAQAIVNMVTKEDLKGVTGKYYKDGAEQTSSEESLKEDLQGQVYELSAKYCHLEGYEPLDAPEPPPQEAPKVKSPKKKSKKDKKVEESAGPSGDAPETDGAEKQKDENGDELKYADDEDKTEAKTEDKKEEKSTDEEKKGEDDEKIVEVEITDEIKPSEPAVDDDEDLKKNVKQIEDDDEDLKKNVEKIEELEITPAPEVAAQ